MNCRRYSPFLLYLKDECSFVSLRDVERTMQVMVWFYKRVDTLGRLMMEVITEQRRQEGEDVDDDDDDADEEVIMHHLLYFERNRKRSCSIYS